MRKTRLIVTIFGLCSALSLYAKTIAGVNEVVTLLPEDIQLDAKLDTGADSSSIDARNIDFFTKDGEEWVRFTVVKTLDKKKHILEYPLERTAKIVSRIPAESLGSGRPHHRRPVIHMNVCIGNVPQTIEVNLFDRGNFTYPFLLGASGLEKFDLVVDVQKTYLFADKCTPQPNKYFSVEHFYWVILLALMIMAIALVVYIKYKQKRNH